MSKKIRKLKKISDAACSVGFSESSLRNYEREGIISPTKSEAGYRYYDLYDISRIMTCRKYRQFGFSFAEIVKLMDHSGLADVRSAFALREKELVSRYRWHDCVLRDFRNTSEALEQFDKNESVLRIEQRPTLYYIEAMVSVASINKAQKRAIKQLTDLIPITKVASRCLLEKDGWVQTESGFSILAEEADVLDVQNKQDYVRMGSQECVAAYVCCKADKKYMLETLPAMQSFAASRGYRDSGTAYMQTYIGFGDDENLRAYRKIWLDIEK